MIRIIIFLGNLTHDNLKGFSRRVPFFLKVLEGEES
jgi:hypothetical protein